MSEQPDYHSKGVVLSRHVLFMAFTSHSRECYGYSGVRVLLGCPVSHNSGGIPKVTTSAIWNVWWLGNKEDGLPPLRKLTISEWSSQDLLKRVWELRRLMLVLEVGSRATHGMAMTYLRAVLRIMQNVPWCTSNRPNKSKVSRHSPPALFLRTGQARSIGAYATRTDSHKNTAHPHCPGKVPSFISPVAGWVYLLPPFSRLRFSSVGCSLSSRTGRSGVAVAVQNTPGYAV